jgi:hypothetical protein
VTEISSVGSLSDLYDFNYLQTPPADLAAIVQLAYGTTSTARKQGEIFKDTFLWDHIFSGATAIDSILYQ